MARLNQTGAGQAVRTRVSPRKVTIAQVAHAASVSPATVSRVLNNPSLVREDLRKKVLGAARRLDYVAHGAARALASRRSRVLGAIVPNLSNTIFSDAIEAFQHRLEQHGYTMLLAKFDYDEEVEYRSVRTMIERGIDGLLLVGVTHGKALHRLLRATSVPFVQTWAPARASEHPTIGYDNAALAGMVVDHLVGLGHRDIGVVAGLARHNDRVVSRLAGIRDALRRHRIPLPEQRVAYTEYRIAEARAAFREIRRSGPPSNRPDREQRRRRARPVAGGPGPGRPGSRPALDCRGRRP